MRILYAIPAILIFITLATVGFYSYSPDTVNASCATALDPAVCYGREVSALLEKKGVAETLSHVNNTITPYAGYGTVHTILHIVGEDAFRKDGSLSQALRYLEPYGSLSDMGKQLGGFDGFFHGAVTQFFASNSGRNIHDLMNEVCETDLALPTGITFDTFECYHAIGHALMYILSNNLDRALTICDDQTLPEKKKGCYNGAFMEYALLYWASYHPESPRGPNLGISMASTCLKETDDLRIFYCAEFIGTSYLARNTNDIRGAFTECELAPTNYTGCIDRMSKMIVPSLFEGDEKKMIASCDIVKPEFVQRCKQNVVEGIQMNALKKTTPTAI